jgi:hypothetical protein
VLIAVLAAAFTGDRMPCAGPSGSSWASPGRPGSSGPPNRADLDDGARGRRVNKGLDPAQAHAAGAAVGFGDHA